MRHALLLLAVILVTLGAWPAASADAPSDAAQSSAAVVAQHPMIVVTFANVPKHPAARAGTTGSRYTGSGYLVGQSAHQQAERVARMYSLREVANWPIRALRVHCVVYEVPDDRPVASVIGVLAKDPDITLAQPLQQFHTLTDSTAATPYNDPLYDLQTNLNSLGIQHAHERSQGDGVRIALIDTGVDTSHPDLLGRIAGTRSFLDEMAGASGGTRHGTAMAGLIAATANNRVGIVGIAPHARVEVLEACWQLKPNADAAACNTFTLARALAAAIDAGIPLINLSIAGPADPLLSALIEAGLKQGCIFVGAAADAADTFPANVPGVIGVGSFEHASGHPTVTAPAVHVLTLRPRAQYDFVSGTSVAAAEVTGVVALLLAADPRLTGRAVQELLQRTAGKGAQANPAGALSTANAVDASAALAQLVAGVAKRVASSSSH
jgi:subtilisin family serine protease